jgi:hypothetical protein
VEKVGCDEEKGGSDGYIIPAVLHVVVVEKESKGNQREIDS